MLQMRGFEPDAVRPRIEPVMEVGRLQQSRDGCASCFTSGRLIGSTDTWDSGLLQRQSQWQLPVRRDAPLQ